MVDALTETDVRRRWIAEVLRLQSVPGLGRARAARWVREEGGLAGALARARREVAAPQLEPADAERAADELTGSCRECEVRIVLPTDPDYPHTVRELADPPLLLYVRGRPIHATERCVAIVGSRRATAYGRRVARGLGRALGEAGVTVVSGLALGIDGEAHAGALEADGRTVAVLASGLDRAYPRAHAHLYRALLAGGAAYGEHPPGTSVRKHHFPERNRLIAALADAVVVVEAAERSGALITARLGLESGRDVWAVPGQIDRPASAGTNALLRDGARPVCRIDEVVDAYAPVRRGHAESRRPAGVSALALEVWDALESGELHLDELALRCDVGGGAAALLAAVSELEIGGWVDRSPGAVLARRVA